MKEKTMKWGAGASVAGAALLALSALALSPAGGQADPPGPPGTNGEVKIDGTAFDDHPDNEPHVGCDFQVDFTNFDAGQSAHVEFALQSPTLAPGSNQNSAANILLTADVVMDENGEADETYNLATALDESDATPQGNQGFHVKLTITSDGLPGNGTKFKVFWVECEVPTPPSSSTTTTSTTSTSTTSTTAPPTTAPPTTAPPAPPAPQAPAPPAGRAPAPAAPQAPAAAPAAAPSGQLAFTGSSTSILAGLGVALLLVGAGLTLVARRRFAT